MMLILYIIFIAYLLFYTSTPTKCDCGGKIEFDGYKNDRCIECGKLW